MCKTTTTATTGVLFAGGAGPAVRCRTAPPIVGIDFADRPGFARGRSCSWQNSLCL
jgi:hypothetical protein